MHLFRRGTEFPGDIIKIRIVSEEVNNFRQSILDTDLSPIDGDFIPGSFSFLSQVFCSCESTKRYGIFMKIFFYSSHVSGKVITIGIISEEVRSFSMNQ